MKRQRGRGRKPGGGGGGGGGGNHGNRPLESNGPEVKIRGTAAQIYEKYAQYARDAQSSGDRVKHESYLQHAEHYFRIMAAAMPRDQRMTHQSGESSAPPMQGEERETDETSADPMKVMDEAGDDDGEGFEGDEGEGGEEDEAQAGGQDDRPEGQEGQGQGQGRGRRRRGRRRHQEGGAPGQNPGGGDRNGGVNSGDRNGGDPEARSALDSLARKQGALAGG